MPRDANTATGSAIEGLVEARYPHEKGWVTFREFTTFQSSRRIDIVALNFWASKEARHAIEVKRTRSDFLRELDQPEKRRWAWDHFGHCWFAVAPGVAEKSEVPEGWGLLVMTKNGKKIIRKRHAKAHKRQPSKDIDLAILRRAATIAAAAEREVEQRVAKARAGRRLVRVLGEEVDEEALAELVEKRVEERFWEQYEHRRQRLREKEDEVHGMARGIEYLRRKIPWSSGLRTGALTEEDAAKLLNVAVARELQSRIETLRTAHAQLGLLLDAAESSDTDAA